MIEAALDEASATAGSALMIGDTSYDMATAGAAGVTAIGVAWGYHEPDELRQAGARHVAGHPLEIIELTRTEA